MSNGRAILKVIEGGQKKPRRKSPVGEVWVCPCCSADVTTQVTIGARIQSGRLTGGTKAFVCAVCLAQGRITRVT